jgi:hypothetical protein
VSADSVVPGNASGGMDGVALKGLTVDFHEPGFAAGLAGENNQPFWFQMSGEQRQRAGVPWGPANPQALNRYSYVQNNPLKYTDPSGHAVVSRSSGWDSSMFDIWQHDIDNLILGFSIFVVTLPIAAELQIGVKGAIVEAKAILDRHPGGTVDIEIGRESTYGWMTLTVRDSSGNIVAVVRQRLLLTASIAMGTAHEQGNWQTTIEGNSSSTVDISSRIQRVSPVEQKINSVLTCAGLN